MTGQSESQIKAAVAKSEVVHDPINDLVGRAKNDPGAPFEPDALLLLGELKRTDPALFERTRAKLKSDTEVRIGELDEALRRSQTDKSNAGHGRSLTLPEIEPWEHPVEGAALLNDIVTEVERYVVAERPDLEAVALWVLHAHAHDTAQISPRLAITSPEKRCGKTTLLSVIQQLVPKPLSASNISASALFRSVELAHPTLLIDEADTFLNCSDELRGIVNSGHNRLGASVIRTVGENHEPMLFNTWAPLAIAMIGRMPETIADRSIAIRLRRRKASESVERFRLDRIENLRILARKAARWVLDNEAAIRAWDGDAPGSLHDRAADNWRPLIAIADVAGGNWPQKADHAATALTAREGDGDSAGTMLLADLKELFDGCGSDRLTTEQILSHLHEKDDRPWSEWRNGKPITARQLAKRLEPFGIGPGSVRTGTDTAKGYKRNAFDDAFTRYLGGASVTPSQANETAKNGHSAIVTGDHAVTVNICEKPRGSACCDAVTDQREVAGQPMAESQELRGPCKRAGNKRVIV